MGAICMYGYIVLVITLLAIYIFIGKKSNSGC